MKAAILQPYFFPYIGYWQLINTVDVLVIYDNIQYTKKGWINRNRYLLKGADTYFTIPLQKQSDYLDIQDRIISCAFDRDKLKNQIATAYKKAPHFETAFQLFSSALDYGDTNLFAFLYHSVKLVMETLDINTKVVVSSTVQADHELKGQDRVIAICEALDADEYINPIGGLELYGRQAFEAKGITLRILKSDPVEYRQLGNEFVPWLSILDVLMFNGIEKTKSFLDLYSLINR